MSHDARAGGMDDDALRMILRKDVILGADHKGNPLPRVIVVELDPIFVLVLADAQTREPAADLFEGRLRGNPLGG